MKNIELLKENGQYKLNIDNKSIDLSDEEFEELYRVLFIEHYNKEHDRFRKIS